MKKFFIIISVLILCLLFTGCGLFDLTNWTAPNDSEFIAVIESLDTPKKAVEYVKTNFEWQLHFQNYSPYQVWVVNTKANTGDCNDMACFLSFVANYHGYKVYQVAIRFKEEFWGHVLCVFVEDGKYTYSSNYFYRPIYADNFREIVDDYFTYQPLKFKSYRVYDYNNNLIEGGY